MNMPMIRHFRLLFPLVVAMTAMLPSAWAANLNWDSAGSSDLWNLTDPNWLPGSVAWTNSSTATFNGVGETVEVDAAIVAARIIISNSGFTIADSNNNGSLTLTANGTGSTAALRIVVPGGGLTTFNEDIILGAANGSTQQIDLAASNTLNMAGRILENSGAGMILNLNGAANSVITLSGSNGHTGGTTTASSNLRINLNNNHALSTGGLSLTGGSTTLDSTVGGVTLANNPLNLISATVGGTNANNVVFLGSNSLDFGTGTVTLGNGDKAIRVEANTLTLGGDVVEDSSPRSLFKNGVGTLALTSANNSFSGTMYITAGTLEVKSLADGGMNSSIGKAGSAASNLVVANGSTLRYTGTGSSSDRLFSLTNGTTGATIDASGAGALLFTNTGALGHTAALTSSRQLILTGTNLGNNTLSALLGDTGSAGGTLSLTKNGAGTWVLAGNNTYTGATTVNAGRLILTGTNTVTGNTVINSGAVVEATDGVGLSAASLLQIRGGVFQSSGTFGRTVSTASGAVNWGSNVANAVGGGFAARGGVLDVRLNNGTGSLTWNGSSFVQNGQALIFGSATANDLVDFQNGINLGSSGVNTRTITVIDNPDFTTDRARISGNITNTAAGQSLLKDGAGVLELTGVNTYSGTTLVNAGTLLVNGNSSGATGQVVVANTALLGGSGRIGGATTISSGGILSPGNSPGTLTFESDLNVNGGGIVRFEGGDLVDVSGALTLSDNWTLALATGFQNGGTMVLFTYAPGLATVDLTPNFDFSGLGFTPSGPVFLTDTGSAIVLNGLSVVPEPAAWALIVGGTLVMALRRRRSNPAA